MPQLTPAQCRAGRGLLDLTQEELAARAGLARSTVRDFEGGRHCLHRASAAQVIRVFDEAGVILLGPDELGPGVRLRAPCGASGDGAERRRDA